MRRLKRALRSVTGTRVAWLTLLAALHFAVNPAAAQTVEREMVARSTPVTVTQVERKNLEVWEPSVGQLEPKVAPLIAAEVAGRLTGVEIEVGDPVKRGALLAQVDPKDFQLTGAAAKADIQQLQALLRSQKLQVNRLRSLMTTKSTSESALDEGEAQLGSLQAQLISARVRLQQAQRDISKTRIVSPVDGRVDERRVSEGDYVKVGTPLFRITTQKWLKACLPFPESLLSQLRTGLPVRMTSPVAPGVMVEAEVSEVRPSITLASRSIQVIVNVGNPGQWEPGASVTAQVRVALHPDALVVPEQSVILRPAGKVVYVIEEGIARQRPVSTGLHLDREVEILRGVDAGETVAVDGAGFLTDGAAVEVKSE